LTGNSTLNLSGGTIHGGTLTNSSTGNIIAVAGTSNTLGGTVNNVLGGQIAVNNGAVLSLESTGTYTNTGNIGLNSTGSLTDLQLTGGGTVTLGGSGTVTMGNNVNNRIYGVSSTALVIGANQLVQGAGQIGLAQTTITNNGTITVNQSAGLTLAPSASGFTNNGTVNVNSNNTLTVAGSGLMTVSAGGYLTGGAGANFYVGGNFTNNSTQSGSWNTSGASLGFQGGVSHQLSVAGSEGQFGWGTLQINGGDSVTVNGNSVTAAATVNNGSLSHVSGNSSLGSLTGTGTLSVGNSSGAAASVTVNSFNQSSITVNATGSLTVAHNSTPALNNTNSLTVAPGGKLDLTNSTLFIHYTQGSDPLSTIIGYVRSGYDNGLWDGSGIASSTAAANSLHTTAIAIVDSADGLVAGMPANTIELKYTLYGDTGLTGSVGFNDFTRLTQHYNQTSGGTWDTGDFNYDGSVNFSDFTLMTRTYSTTLGPTAVGAIDPAASSVPEPSAVMLGLASLLLMTRRRLRVETPCHM
jgi:hypothetical protein